MSTELNANDFLKYNFTDIKDESDFFPPPSRRDFIKRFGGGIVIAVALTDFLSVQAQEEVRNRGGRRGLPSDFNAFLKIGEDGRVTCLTGKIEMGQGIMTSLPQMLAEELDAPLDTVDIVLGDTDACPWDMGTFGSRSTQGFGPPLRAAAAEARAVLLDLAAEQFKVPVTQLTVKDAVITDSQNKEHRVTYAQLAKGKTIERHLESRPSVKNPADAKAGFEVSVP